MALLFGPHGFMAVAVSEGRSQPVPRPDCGAPCWVRCVEGAVSGTWRCRFSSPAVSSQPLTTSTAKFKKGKILHVCIQMVLECWHIRYKPYLLSVWQPEFD